MPATVRMKYASSWVRDVTGVADPKIRAGAELVAMAQRAAIPVSRDGSYGRIAGYARSRIAVRVAFDATRGRVYDVGSDATTPDGVSYPLILDVGSAPHTIESHGDYPLRNRRTGQIFGRVVHHPGTAATHWCRNSILVLAGRKL
jgi:hypothetical protein